jgi:ElaB/YqjD/DUF883 family membrane-anchored ribosome-binding protein
MDQRERQLQHEIAVTREAMGQKIAMIEARVHAALDGARGTVDSLMESFERIQQTVTQTKATVDSLMEAVETTTSEAADNVRCAATLIQQVKQRPWLTLGSAVLVGYILGSLAGTTSSGANGAKVRPSSRSSP